jgi:hypothetical protein
VIFLGALLLLDLEIGQGLGEAGDGGDLDAQRAPVHSGSCGALLRLCEAICDLFRFYVRPTLRLAFAGVIAR